MIEKVIKNTQDLNEYARYLRGKQEFDRIKKLAYDWLIPDKYVDDFIAGKRFLLADVNIEEKDYESANEKLAEEMNLINDEDFAGIIGIYICRKCSDPEYEAHVLQHHKTLQKCLDYILQKVFAIAKEKHEDNGMRKAGGVGMGMGGKKVFVWVDEYYALDDFEAETLKKEQAQLDFIKKREKAEKDAKERAEREEKRKKQQEKKVKKEEEKKRAEETKKAQLSIFDLMQPEAFEQEDKKDDATANVVSEAQDLQVSENDNGAPDDVPDHSEIEDEFENGEETEE